jgi:beta-fructofuranosidase
MRTSRRNFLRTAAASTAVAALSQHARAIPAEDLRTKLAADPLRPQFHLLPAKNWMNDPNGPIYWKGQYHMFFQYNPGAAVWGDMHWAHAVSEDMIHWRHLPVALAPTPGWDDADGCFTGSAVDDHGIATVLYTGVKRAPIERATLRDGHNNFREVQCLATSTDTQLRTWTKWPHPVLEPPADPQLAGFRDPFLWRQKDTWILGVASGQFKKGGCVLLYRSKDLRQWEFLHELASGHWTEKESESTNPVDSGEMWECPDFFPLGNKHVLLYSTAGKVIWESGELDQENLKFHSERQGVLDHGVYYAQKTQLDAQGNRILWGWIPEKRPDSEAIAAGWAGCMALPRVLSLDSSGRLEMVIAPAARSLRAKAFALPAQNADPEKRAGSLRNVTLEKLSAEITWNTSGQSSALILEDRSGSWWSASLTQCNSVQTLTVNDASVEVPLGVSPSHHEFRLYLDGSVAELNLDRKHAITTRIYREPDGPLRIKVTAGDLAQLISLETWQLRPISPDRLTT